MSEVSVVVASVITKLQSIADISNRALEVLSEDDFLDKIKGLPCPSIGVVYEGMRATNKDDRASHRVGLAAELGLSLVLVTEGKAILGGASPTSATTVLDSMRNVMKDTRSPTGHFWRFVLEAPALEKGGRTLWIQRWSSPIILA